MNDCGTKSNNERHEAALAITEAAIIEAATNPKVKYVKVGVAIRGVGKATINKKSRTKVTDEPILAGLKPVEKFRAMLSHHKQLTRQQLNELTGVDVATLSKCAGILEAEGFLTRGPSGAGMGRGVLFSLKGNK